MKNSWKSLTGKRSVRPTEILLVIDSMTGQDAVNVAESFDQKLGGWLDTNQAGQRYEGEARHYLPGLLPESLLNLPV